MRMEKLKRKIEEGGELYIPRYVSERIENYILDLGYAYSEEDINNAWRELKGNYGKMSGENTSVVELYGSQCHIIAYLQYYFFLNYPAMKWVLLKNLENGTEIIPRKDLIKILDFGAGPGTASMAVCDFLEDAREIGIYENTRVKLYFDEKCGFFSECYRKMLGRHGRVESIKYVFDRQNWYKESFYDMIIVSYALSELDSMMQEWFLSKAQNCLKNGGYLVIIEPAYKGMRKYIGDFLRDRQVRRSFRIVDASGPLCSEQNCNQWGECYDKSVKRKKIRTPERMTEEMKRFFDGRKEGRIKWVYAVLKKVEEQKKFVDPSELGEYQRGGGKIIKLRGWVVEKEKIPTEKAKNITLCNGLGRCNLAFWRDKGVVFKRAKNISEGDILCVEGELLTKAFSRLRLPSVSVTEIVEHIKRVD